MGSVREELRFSRVLISVLARTDLPFTELKGHRWPSLGKEPRHLALDRLCGNVKSAAGYMTGGGGGLRIWVCTLPSGEQDAPGPAAL